jgi:hypothetical protein
MEGMKIVVIATRQGEPDEIAKYLEPEAKKALQFVADEFFREIYSRADGNGAVIVLEAASEEEARKRLDELPLVERGLIRLELYPVKPYRAIAAMAAR